VCVCGVCVCASFFLTYIYCSH